MLVIKQYCCIAFRSQSAYTLSLSRSRSPRQKLSFGSQQTFTVGVVEAGARTTVAVVAKHLILAAA